jgi:hypothetical protein
VVGGVGGYGGLAVGDLERLAVSEIQREFVGYVWLRSNLRDEEVL